MLGLATFPLQTWKVFWDIRKVMKGQVLAGLGVFVDMDQRPWNLKHN
jgi:hypothetical protein